MELTPMKEASKRVEAYKKANPLTIEQIMNMSLVKYYEDLQIRFLNEVIAEREKKVERDLFLGRLKRIDIRYKEYLEEGANGIEAAEGSIEEVLGSCPYIHQDDDGFPTHFFYNNYVYFFGGGIYKAI